MSWTLDGKIRIRARLSNTSYMRLHSWTSVSLRRLYISQFLSLHFKDRDKDVLSKGSKDILHDNKIFSCTMELPNDSASLVVIFVLFCFIWDESVTSSFNQKYQKSFYSYDKNKLFSYDNIRGIQQARSISFLSFFGESTIKRVNKSEIFNPRTTMTMISSVNTDIGAECFSVALEPSTSRKAARRPTTWAGSDLTTIKSAKKKKKIRK